MDMIGVLVSQFIQPALVHHQLALGSQNQLLNAVATAVSNNHAQNMAYQEWSHSLFVCISNNQLNSLASQKYLTSSLNSLCCLLPGYIKDQLCKLDEHQATWRGQIEASLLKHHQNFETLSILIPSSNWLRLMSIPGTSTYNTFMNEISILVLKTQELSPSSQKTDQTLQDSPGPANPLSQRLKLLNYSATRRPTTENFLNSCQSATKLVPTKTHTYKGNVTWLMKVGEGPTANLPRANTGALESTLEALESNPDPPKTTQVTQSGQEPTHLLNCITKLTSYSKTY
ncbi:hypothetical protein DSO57_1005252 [Entomophthora muscae]|uniref:Uncharacterized protein n=1 Tax=Entomophthora muscae TaxID=34485 RepID=A0ACC2SX02_9FUNG|nr:hypothetical protein DSO57_1005252 [Entomophthora muscae]